MIKAVEFSYKGGFAQGSRTVIDTEENIPKRIEALCADNYHCDHTEPTEVPLEDIRIQELSALDLVNLLRLGVQLEKKANKPKPNQAY